MKVIGRSRYATKERVVKYIERCYALGVPAILDGVFEVTLLQGKIYLKNLNIDSIVGTEKAQKIYIQLPDYIYGILKHSIEVFNIHKNIKLVVLDLNKVEFIDTYAIQSVFGTSFKIYGDCVKEMGVHAIICKLTKKNKFSLCLKGYTCKLATNVYINLEYNKGVTVAKRGLLKIKAQG